MLLVELLLVIAKAVPPVLQEPAGVMERSSFAPAVSDAAQSSNPAIGINHNFQFLTNSLLRTPWSERIFMHQGPVQSLRNSDSRRSKSYRHRPHDSVRGYIHDGDRAGERVGDVDLSAIGGERNAGSTEERFRRSARDRDADSAISNVVAGVNVKERQG